MIYKLFVCLFLHVTLITFQVYPIQRIRQPRRKIFFWVVSWPTEAKLTVDNIFWSFSLPFRWCKIITHTLLSKG